MFGVLRSYLTDQILARIFLCRCKWMIVAAHHAKFGLDILLVYKMCLSTFQLMLFYFFGPSVSHFLAQSDFSLPCLEKKYSKINYQSPSIVIVGEEDPKLPEGDRLVQQCGRLSKLTDIVYTKWSELKSCCLSQCQMDEMQMFLMPVVDFCPSIKFWWFMLVEQIGLLIFANADQKFQNVYNSGIFVVLQESDIFDQMWKGRGSKVCCQLDNVISRPISSKLALSSSPSPSPPGIYQDRVLEIISYNAALSLV